MNRTNRTIGFVGWAMLACLLIAGALVIAAVSAAGGVDSTLIRIDGEPMQFTELGIGHGLVALACIAGAMLVLMLVVPLAVLIPLAIAAVALVGALLVAAGVMAMLFSPLILLGLVVWLIVRSMRRSGPTNGAPAPADRSATIAG